MIYVEASLRYLLARNELYKSLVKALSHPLFPLFPLFFFNLTHSQSIIPLFFQLFYAMPAHYFTILFQYFFPLFFFHYFFWNIPYASPLFHVFSPLFVQCQSIIPLFYSTILFHYFSWNIPYLCQSIIPLFFSIFFHYFFKFPITISLFYLR